jgi:nicotinate-nucleotide pyrophosphorylase (carboxylating)
MLHYLRLFSRFQEMTAVALDMDTVRPLIEDALAEDIGDVDRTTESIVSEKVTAEAQVLAKEPGVVAGIPVAIRVFEMLDPRVHTVLHIQDGQRIRGGETILNLHGQARALLSGERVALNFLQHLSGIATQTARFVDVVAGTGVRILDTRKTTPNLRYLEKYAVTMGGGHNHRFGLYDMALIKDNHIKIAGSIRAALSAVRDAFPQLPVEVETTSVEQVKEAVQAGAERIMLDNMTPEEVREAVDLVRGQIEGSRQRIEVSGNITLKNVLRMAMVGVDDISVGAITHSSLALDISMIVRPSTFHFTVRS